MSYSDGNITIGGVLLDAWIFKSAVGIIKEGMLVLKVGKYIKMTYGCYPPDFKYFAARESRKYDDGSIEIECAFGFRDEDGHYTVAIGRFATEQTGKMVIACEIDKTMRPTDEQWRNLVIKLKK